MKGEIKIDFFTIRHRNIKKGVVELYPDFIVGRSKDIMIRSKSFYAVWDETRSIWSTDEYDLQKLVDEKLRKAYEDFKKTFDGKVKVRWMCDFSSKSWVEYRRYLQNMADNNTPLDTSLYFLNSELKKGDYASKTLPYSMESGSIEAYDELMNTLYDPEERAKLEWAIGAIISGDAKKIQKFIVLYGAAGSGKSTVLNIIQRLFDGYYTTFEAKALTSSNNAFSTEAFKENPLVAIQHDGDLSKIEDNTKLNSIVSHEEMTINEKYKPSYTSRVNCFLFMGTNKPVKITDAKSGIIRRLIDVRPSGRKLPPKRYQILVNQIEFEHGAIAKYCLEEYRRMGKNFYSNYTPISMQFQTDVFFNFVESNFYTFHDQDGTTLKQAYDMYKTYCAEALIEFKLPLYKFREELKNYFKEFKDVTRNTEGKQVRSVYIGFITARFFTQSEESEEPSYYISLDSSTSLVDENCKDCYAQYANDDGTPKVKWASVNTKLSSIDTRQLHFVKIPKNHIVIDFDLKDDSGEKSLELNLTAASSWPATYSEVSKSGKGLHLHYIYDGDASKLSSVYSEAIEIKVFKGNSALRRKLTACNDIPIATISSGLPVKGEEMIDFKSVTNEKSIRTLIRRNLLKEIHPGTKPSVDFIYKILKDAHDSGMTYDVTDLRPAVLAFANNSSNQSDYCIKLVGKMQFASEETSEAVTQSDNDAIAFYDVEVFKNLFIVVWKFEGAPHVKMINPTPSEIEELIRLKLIGFNCRRYDNHILYARYIGYDNEQLYVLSQKIISGSRNAMFGEAYNISYTDVYDFSSKKQSLKKFEIELGIHHQELGLKWEEPVPKELWDKVADYCCNDVDATEATFHSRKQDFIARQVLADLSGLSVNDTTQMHTAKIIFGTSKRPQDEFVYTDLSERFPGYTFEAGKSQYRGEDPKEGGYVYAEPNMYGNVALLDVASMHPNSLISMDMFGPYTQNFKDLVNARLAIKYKEYDSAKKMLGGVLEKYLGNKEDADALAYALKIVINIVYGLTSAKFDNKFRDPRNKDNIVAKRGALFMIDLKHAVQEKGYQVAHIKTDSIKIPDSDPEIIEFVMAFGKKYGYTFEHEMTFDKLCLINDAVYAGKIGWTPSGKGVGKWTATGAQFIHPYVFKKCFSKEKITFEDLCETKAVSTSLYLNMGTEEEPNYQFVGKVGQFCPIKSGCGGGLLCREKEGRFYAATGSKGYRWLESETVKLLEKEDDIDVSFFEKLVTDAKKAITWNDDIYEWFVSEEPYDFDNNPLLPF